MSPANGHAPAPSTTSKSTSAKHLVLVSGPGRSGTSAITGALSELGIHIPPPLVEANRSNPRGFFETRWVVEFHKSVLAKASTYEFDPDPAAVERVQRIIDARMRRQLREWLAGAAAADSQQFAIKDPRTVWLHDLWAEVAAENAMTTSYLTTLRHPAEVAGSRERYYGQSKDADRARAYAVNKVAGWINVSLLNERQTRSNRRVFVRYNDLVTNWRSVMTSVQGSLGLEFTADVTSTDAHPIDEFIAPSLHHVLTTWDDLEVPVELRTIADAVWAASEQLADEGSDAALEAEFDHLSEQYRKLFTSAAAITSDLRRTAVKDASAKAERDASAKAERDASAKAERDASAKAERDASAKAEREASAKAEREASAKAEREALAESEPGGASAVAEAAKVHVRRVARAIKRRLPGD